MFQSSKAYDMTAVVFWAFPLYYFIQILTKVLNMNYFMKAVSHETRIQISVLGWLLSTACLFVSFMLYDH